MIFPEENSRSWSRKKPGEGEACAGYKKYSGARTASGRTAKLSERGETIHILTGLLVKV